MVEGRRRRRNTLTVKMDLISAVGTVLKKHGFAKLGISIVAEEANVDKTVVYRNFQEFENLLEAYIEKQDYWLLTLKERGSVKIEDKRSFLKSLLVEQFKAIYSNEELQQLLIWGLADKDGYISTIALKREILSKGINEQYEHLLDEYGINFSNFSALMVAGIYYVILNKDKSTFCDVDINKKDDKENFIKTIEWLIDLIFDKIERKNEVIQIAKSLHKEGVDIKIIQKATKLTSEYLNKILD